MWVAGRQVPVDPHGNFVAEEILPTGMHTVEVAVLDDGGNGSLYLRDLEFKRKRPVLRRHRRLHVSEDAHARAVRSCCRARTRRTTMTRRWTAASRST